MKIKLEIGPHGTWQVIAPNGESRLFQSDWDWPGLAIHLGWVPCHQCRETDGTMDCEHRTASEMIQAANRYLAVREGDEFEDPGYFERTLQ